MTYDKYAELTLRLTCGNCQHHIEDHEDMSSPTARARECWCDCEGFIAPTLPNEPTSVEKE